MLSDNGSFRPIYIEEILHRTESVSLSVAKGGIGTKLFLIISYLEVY